MKLKKYTAIGGGAVTIVATVLGILETKKPTADEINMRDIEIAFSKK